MWKLVGIWVWRVVCTVWAAWLTFKQFLGLPGDWDDAQQWQRLLQRWGVWDTVIDPRPWVFFIALALSLWAWDVPRRVKIRIVSRWHYSTSPIEDGSLIGSLASHPAPQSAGRSQETKPRWYECCEFLWRIDPGFVDGYDEYQVDDLWSGAVSNLIAGPHCQHCKRDVAQTQCVGCPGCSKEFTNDGIMLLQIRDEYMDKVKSEGWVST